MKTFIDAGTFIVISAGVAGAALALILIGSVDHVLGFGFFAHQSDEETGGDDASFN